jgi:hypothetical protein
MNPEVLVALCGVLGQLIVGGFFFGAMHQQIKNLVSGSVKTDTRVDAVEVKIGDHTLRISLLESDARQDEADREADRQADRRASRMKHGS